MNDEAGVKYMIERIRELKGRVKKLRAALNEYTANPKLWDQTQDEWFAQIALKALDEDDRIEKGDL